MRLPFILAPLAALLFASCEPGKEHAGAGDGPFRDTEHGRNPSSTSAPNHERLAAQASVGRLPLPRNLVANVEDICPLHHEKMKLREIPIVFAESAPGLPVAAEFPFGAEEIVSSGNALLPGEPLSARVYQCAACLAARHAAEEKGASAGPAPPVPASE